MSQVNAAQTANAQLGTQISIAVAKKTQDVQELQGQAALALLESAAALQGQSNGQSNGPFNPNLGQLIDTTA